MWLLHVFGYEHLHEVLIETIAFFLIILGFPFRSKVHFALYFEYGAKHKSSIIFSLVQFAETNYFSKNLIDYLFSTIVSLDLHLKLVAILKFVIFYFSTSYQHQTIKLLWFFNGSWSK